MAEPEPLKTSMRSLSSVGHLLVQALALLQCCCWPAWGAGADAAENESLPATNIHQPLFNEDRFPTASDCRTCHPGHYEEWSVSPHAYAQLSPVFNAMHATLLKLSNGTQGDFCIRCHTHPGMTLAEPLVMSNMDRSPISREGVTCIVCHRVVQPYGKASGRRALTEGTLLEPIKGPTGNAELLRVLANSSDYRVVTNQTVTGRRIHGQVEPFFQLTQPEFCGGCHDVTLPNGFRLEEAFSGFNNSPAARRGETCQDCHMSPTPGRKSPFPQAPAAVIGGVPTRPRTRTNHMFPGPDYSILHPGIFPHNPRAAELATMREWLTFDYQAGWGTDAFEHHLLPEAKFPSRWRSVDDRYDARALIEDQLALLDRIRDQRLALLQEGYRLGPIEVTQAGRRGLRFEIEVSSGTDGHAVPTGFDAERLVFLQVSVTDATGAVLFESGDLDPNGDVRDLHSAYVRGGKLPLDRALFSLQSRFMTTSLRGGEREEVLAINRSIDPLPFVRPQPFSTILTGRPAGVRIHRRGLPPGGSRRAKYAVGRRQLTGQEPYRIEVKLIAAMVPVNLVHEVAAVGFDYGLSAQEVAARVVEGHMVLWERALPVSLNGPSSAPLAQDHARKP